MSYERLIQNYIKASYNYPPNLADQCDGCPQIIYPNCNPCVPCEPCEPCEPPCIDLCGPSPCEPCAIPCNPCGPPRQFIKVDVRKSCCGSASCKRSKRRSCKKRRRCKKKNCSCRKKVCHKTKCIEIITEPCPSFPCAPCDPCGPCGPCEPCYDPCEPCCDPCEPCCEPCIPCAPNGSIYDPCYNNDPCNPLSGGWPWKTNSWKGAYRFG